MSSFPAYTGTPTERARTLCEAKITDFGKLQAEQWCWAACKDIQATLNTQLDERTLNHWHQLHTETEKYLTELDAYSTFGGLVRRGLNKLKSWSTRSKTSRSKRTPYGTKPLTDGQHTTLAGLQGALRNLHGFQTPAGSNQTLVGQNDTDNGGEPTRSSLASTTRTSSILAPSNRAPSSRPSSRGPSKRGSSARVSYGGVPSTRSRVPSGSSRMSPSQMSSSPKSSGLGHGSEDLYGLHGKPPPDTLEFNFTKRSDEAPVRPARSDQKEHYIP